MRQIANPIYCIALLSFSLHIAIGGVSAAPLGCKNCVGGPQLKSNSVKNSKIANAAVSREKLGSDVHAVGLENVVVVAGSDFNANSFSVNCILNDDTFAWNYGGTSDPCCILAPVRLPDGVTINAFEVSAKYGGASTVDVDLQSKDVRDEEPAQDIATVFFQPTSQFQTVTDSDIGTVVDSKTTIFYIRLCLLQSGDTFYGARVFYE